MYSITTPISFLRTAKKFFKRHPELKERFRDVITLLQKNPHDPSLKLHVLDGKLAGLQAVRLSYKYRMTLLIKLSRKNITLLDIGSHDDVYR